jgi:NAD(P)-dependent dehydrogenase (short-subunit alcohol dehydrogenase family)
LLELDNGVLLLEKPSVRPISNGSSGSSDNQLLSYIRSQWTTLPEPDTTFAGQYVIVTGANVGLGLEAARHYTRLGAAKVILGVRDEEKGRNAQLDIQQSVGVNGVVEVWQVDLQSFESVKDFCARASKLRRLDVVVENAGIAKYTFEKVEDHESTITVNVISTFLMALLLLPKLRETARDLNRTPHLTIVASDAHETVSLNHSSFLIFLLTYTRRSSVRNWHQPSSLLLMTALNGTNLTVTRSLNSSRSSSFESLGRL